MAKVVKSLSLNEINDEIISKCCFINDCNNITTDGYETPDYEVLLHYVGETDDLASIEILDLKKVYKNIDKEECLPDVGLLDYKDDELALNLKDVTLRELYKEVLKKVI
ncbi:MAG: hypothetical protein MR639_15275 [Clostridium sp.]|jgi:hypothetical protein|uniref:hypothetical protein n=1 Tax=Clostridium sp. TaxID=1506 RepID=UPI002A903117|nr:hypothetical protein [Clostridium sp.]MDY5098516.1 hypothetical protein [Clostridium sp.]